MSGLAQISLQLALAREQHHAAIVFGGFGFVVEQSGADDVVGLVQRRQHRIEPAINRVVALRPEPVHFLFQMIGDEVTGQIAGADDGVVALVGDVELAELPLHRIRRPRRVGDQDHGAALPAERMQRLAGFRKCLEAVVHHAPDVAEHDIDLAHEIAQVLDETKRHRLRRHSGARPPVRAKRGPMVSNPESRCTRKTSGFRVRAKTRAPE